MDRRRCRDASSRPEMSLTSPARTDSSLRCSPHRNASKRRSRPTQRDRRLLREADGAGRNGHGLGARQDGRSRLWVQVLEITGLASGRVREIRRELEETRKESAETRSCARAMCTESVHTSACGGETSTEVARACACAEEASTELVQTSACAEQVSSDLVHASACAEASSVPGR
jgi:hypothetical protein